MRQTNGHDMRRPAPKPPIDWPRRMQKIARWRGWKFGAESDREIGEIVGMSGRTVEGWRLRFHTPDRRARATLRGLWKEYLRWKRAEALRKEREGESDDA